MDASKRGGELPYISKQAAMVLRHYSAIDPHNLEGRTQHYSIVRYSVRSLADTVVEAHAGIIG